MINIPVTLYKDDKKIHQIGMKKNLSNDQHSITADDILVEYAKEFKNLTEDQRKSYGVPTDFDTVEIEMSGIPFRFNVTIDEENNIKKAPRKRA